MKSHSLDVSSTNCAKPGASGRSSTQMWEQLFDFSFSVAKASSAASSMLSSSGLWEGEFEWFMELDLNMLTSGSPGQNEISLTPPGKKGSGVISEKNDSNHLNLQQPVKF